MKGGAELRDCFIISRPPHGAIYVYKYICCLCVYPHLVIYTDIYNVDKWNSSGRSTCETSYQMAHLARYEFADGYVNNCNWSTISLFCWWCTFFHLFSLGQTLDLIETGFWEIQSRFWRCVFDCSWGWKLDDFSQVWIADNVGCNWTPHSSNCRATIVTNYIKLHQLYITSLCIMFGSGIIIAIFLNH